jgi:hypothetical protein
MYYTTSLFEDIFPRYPVVNIRDNASSGKGGTSLHLIDLSAGSWHQYLGHAQPEPQLIRQIRSDRQVHV